MGKRQGRQTTIERLTELRQELDLEKKKVKSGKRKLHTIDVRKMSKKKRKKLRNKMNPELIPYFNSYTKEQKDEFWYSYEQFDSLYDFDEAEERYQRQKDNDKKKEKYIKEKLADIDTDDIDDLIKIDKILNESYNKKRFKKFRKFGYEIGEDDIIYVNEDKLIDSLRKRRKEMKKINESFHDYLDATFGEDSKYAIRADAVDRKISKQTKDLLQSFEVVARESSIFRLK